MNINFSNLIKQLMPIFILVCVAYLLTSSLYFILPQHGIEFNSKQNIVLKYRKAYISKILAEKKKKIIKQKPVVKVQKKEYKFLDNVVLKAVYAMEEQTGWIVIANKIKKTFVLSIGENYKGYELTRIYTNYVIFNKAEQDYKLALSGNKQVNYTVTKQSNDTNKNIKIVVSDDKMLIKRSYLNNYVNDLDRIWRDIAINEKRDRQGKIEGFKVDNINPKSIFARLGLKRYDIIKAVNNIQLKSYNDAFSVYKQINTIKNLNMLILRNGREMELDYEIR